MKRFRTYRILAPAAALYSAVQHVRNIMYDKGIFRTEEFAIPVICVGNITTGGTGKTPMIQYLAENLKNQYSIAVLSRGYGRHSKGFILAGKETRQPEIGDEPHQIHRRYPEIAVAVAEKRAEGIHRLTECVKPDVILLDDAFQHRAVKPSYSLLLTDYNRNMFDDAVLPAGRLREKISGIHRADLIVVTKCPADISNEEMDKEAERFASYGKPVFFTTLRYGHLTPLIPGQPQQETKKALMMTGIAAPQPMKEHLCRLGYRLEEICFPDHHSFRASDIRRMESALDDLGTGSIMITTEKDAARLSALNLPDSVAGRTFVLPVDTEFVRDAGRFKDMITEHIINFTK